MANFVKSVPITKGTVNVYQSKTGKFYGCFASSGEFIGMVASDFDATKPAAIISVADEETGESWDFIGNSKEVAYTI